MSFLDDLGGYVNTAQTELNQVGGLVKQGQALQRQITGTPGGPAPQTVDQPLQGIAFAPWAIAGIIGLLILGVAFGARR